MIKEEKQLLLQDLCARLPYYTKLYSNVADGNWAILTPVVISNLMSATDKLVIKPYLRPMSSMTNEEIKYKLSNFFRVINTNIEGVGYKPTLNTFSAIKYIDWLNKNHFDYHGLIEKGLAIEAPEGMYNNQK